MQSVYKNWGATNTPKSLADENKTYGRDNSLAVQGLQEIRDMAWYLAVKYRFDPALGRAHVEYLTLLNGILKECEA